MLLLAPKTTNVATEKERRSCCRENLEPSASRFEKVPKMQFILLFSQTVGFGLARNWDCVSSVGRVQVLDSGSEQGNCFRVLVFASEKLNKTLPAGRSEPRNVTAFCEIFLAVTKKRRSGSCALQIDESTWG